MKFANIKSLFLAKFWDSPTITTWGSYITTLLNWLILLPIALTRLSTTEIALWYFFRIITDLRPIVDMGFSPTFIRQIAYAFGGSEEFEKPNQNINNEANIVVNWNLVEQTYFTMNTIYRRLSFLLLFLLATIGSITAIRPISGIDNPMEGWISWIVVASTATIYLRGNSYTSFLQGSNNIPLYRRWETLFGLAAIPTGVIVLMLGGGLLGLVIVEQFWLVISVIRNKYLTKSICTFNIGKSNQNKFNVELFKAIWPRAWRSGIGILMSFGVMQFSGIVYSQIGDPTSVASYLLSLRFAQNINTFSRVPFYSQIPKMAIYYAENHMDELITIAKNGMKISNWIFSLGFIGFGLIAPPVLTMINSNAVLVSQSLWAIIGLALFVERYGAMHLQLFTLTNKVIWHIVNGVSGCVTLIFSFLSIRRLGLYAFPVGYLIGYLSFYTWYSAKLSFSTYNLNFWRFEKSASFLPTSIFLFYFLLAIIM